MCGGCDSDSECSPKNFLFSNTEAWRLYSPENRESRTVRIFYLAWRWFGAILFIGFLVPSIVLPQYDDERMRVKWFLYLTNWAYLLFCTSQLVNVIVATIGFCSKDDLDDSETVRWYMRLNWFFYVLSSSPAILITLLFWFLFYVPGFPIVIDTPVTHGVNAAFVLIDIWITAMPIKVLQFYIPTTFGTTYVLFSITYDFLGGTNAQGEPYIYSALDWTEGNTATMVIQGVGSVIAVAALHFILFGFYKLRIFIYSKCLHNAQNEKKAIRYDSVEMNG